MTYVTYVTYATQLTALLKPSAPGAVWQENMASVLEHTEFAPDIKYVVAYIYSAREHLELAEPETADEVVDAFESWLGAPLTTARALREIVYGCRIADPVREFTERFGRGPQEMLELAGMVEDDLMQAVSTMIYDLATGLEAELEDAA